MKASEVLDQVGEEISDYMKTHVHAPTHIAISRELLKMCADEDRGVSFGPRFQLYGLQVIIVPENEIRVGRML